MKTIADDLAELVAAARTGNRDALAQLFDRLSASIRVAARRTARWWATIEDRESIAAVGLIESAHRFDPERGVSFKTFAYSRMRGAILDAARFDGRMKRSPLSADDWRRVRERFEADPARPPSDLEVARAAEVGEALAARAVRWLAFRRTASLDCAREERDYLAIEPGYDDPEPLRLDATDEALVILRSLPERERRLLRAYFGIGLPSGRVMSKIAAEEGLTEGRVSQLIARALRMLRQQFVAPELEGAAVQRR